MSRRNNKRALSGWVSLKIGWGAQAVLIDTIIKYYTC